MTGALWEAMLAFLAEVSSNFHWNDTTRLSSYSLHVDFWMERSNQNHIYFQVSRPSTLRLINILFSLLYRDFQLSAGTQ